MLRRLKRAQGARDLPGGGGEIRELRAASESESYARCEGEGENVFVVQRGAYRDAAKASGSCAPSGRSATTTQECSRWSARMVEVEHRRQWAALASCSSWGGRDDNLSRMDFCSARVWAPVTYWA